MSPLSSNGISYVIPIWLIALWQLLVNHYKGDTHILFMGVWVTGITILSLKVVTPKHSRLSLLFHFIPSLRYRLVVVVWSLHERFLALGLKMHTSVNYMAQGDFGTHVDRSLLLTIDSRHSTCASSPENQLHLLTSLQFRQCWFSFSQCGINLNLISIKLSDKIFSSKVC